MEQSSKGRLTAKLTDPGRERRGIATNQIETIEKPLITKLLDALEEDGLASTDADRVEDSVQRLVPAAAERSLDECSAREGELRRSDGEAALWLAIQTAIEQLTPMLMKPVGVDNMQVVRSSISRLVDALVAQPEAMRASSERSGRRNRDIRTDGK